MVGWFGVHHPAPLDTGFPNQVEDRLVRYDTKASMGTECRMLIVYGLVRGYRNWNKGYAADSNNPFLS